MEDAISILDSLKNENDFKSIKSFFVESQLPESNIMPYCQIITDLLVNKFKVSRAKISIPYTLTNHSNILSLDNLSKRVEECKEPFISFKPAKDDSQTSHQTISIKTF